MAAPSFQELYDLGKAEALIRRPSVTFKPGDVSDMVVAGAAAMADRLIGYAADRVKATYIDGAKGADLTVLADDHWGITRQAAVKAFGSVTFNRTVATANPVTFAAGFVVATQRDSTGREIRFVTTAPASWVGAATGTVTVTAEAETGGSDGNVAATKINRIVSTTSEGTFTVSNAGAFVGGSPEETDEELRERIRLFPSTLRRGTLGALEYGAREVAGVKYATAVEDSSGIVTVYVTDTSGASTGVLVTCAPSVIDDGTMTKKVAVELENWRAGGSLVNVSGGSLLSVDIQITLTIRAGANVAALVTNVTSAVAARIALLKIGDTLYRSALQAAVRNVDPATIVEAAVLMRTGANPFAAVDIAPAANQILRSGSVTVA